MVRGVLRSYAWLLTREHPVIGVGAGMMPYHVLERSGGESFMATHNTLLTIAAEMGFVAVVAFCWFFGALLWALWRTAQTAVAGPVRVLSQALALAFVSAFLVGLSFDAQRQRVVWLMAALAVAAVRLRSRPRPGTSNRTLQVN